MRDSFRNTSLTKINKIEVQNLEKNKKAKSYKITKALNVFVNMEIKLSTTGV